ncbi:Hypothetical_protein [Hexamita inflata]|uniref:Hypothetical_protein n=1 Tax=Hexamita inflata TaxID=28002 RepID=A0AA86R5Y7_9EUKA|nr:Hypothetical protein HINF_LOCUS50305 [Hexamita inflata]
MSEDKNYKKQGQKEVQKQDKKNESQETSTIQPVQFDSFPIDKTVKQLEKEKANTVLFTEKKPEASIMKAEHTESKPSQIILNLNNQIQQNQLDLCNNFKSEQPGLIKCQNSAEEKQTDQKQDQKIDQPMSDMSDNPPGLGFDQNNIFNNSKDKKIMQNMQQKIQFSPFEVSFEETEKEPPNISSEQSEHSKKQLQSYSSHNKQETPEIINNPFDESTNEKPEQITNPLTVSNNQSEMQWNVFKTVVFEAIKNFFKIEFKTLEEAFIHYRKAIVGTEDGKPTKINLNFKQMASDCKISEKQCRQQFFKTLPQKILQEWPQDIVSAIKARLNQLWEQNQEPDIATKKKIIKDTIGSEFKLMQQVQYNYIEIQNKIDYILRILK